MKNSNYMKNVHQKIKWSKPAAFFIFASPRTQTLGGATDSRHFDQTRTTMFVFRNAQHKPFHMFDPVSWHSAPPPPTLHLVPPLYSMDWFYAFVLLKAFDFLCNTFVLGWSSFPLPPPPPPRPDYATAKKWRWHIIKKNVVNSSRWFSSYGVRSR